MAADGFKNIRRRAGREKGPEKVKDSKAMDKEWVVRTHHRASHLTNQMEELLK